MKVTDITGVIQNGMWNDDPPFPRFNMKPLGKVPWVSGEVYCEVFEGLHSQTGTYLETPAHYYGNDKCYLVADLPVEKLLNIPCVILNLDCKFSSDLTAKLPITREMLENCPGSRDISKDCAILIGTGWGKYWMDESYLSMSPYFTYEAMMWLIEKKPFLLGADLAKWENLKKPQGFFEKFYAADILMLAPCINIEKIIKTTGKLTVLPLNISGTSAVPCRAVVIEESD